jgi:hypothetical protein
VSTTLEFQTRSPEGGCLRTCGERLNCGHACSKSCHRVDISHQFVFCMEQCVRTHDACSHPCRKACGEKCGRCSIDVVLVVFDNVKGDLVLPCGHTKQNVLCYETQGEIRCHEKVERVLAGCKHLVEVSCYTNIENHKCMIKCDEILGCGHVCSSTCGDCSRASTEHVACKTICSRPLACSIHTCQAVCHSESNNPCPPCRSSCTLSGIFDYTYFK